MKKGEKVTHEQLKEFGYTHCINYGKWEVWVKYKVLRVLVDIKTREVMLMYNCNQSVEEL